MAAEPSKTQGAEYADRLDRLASRRWKRLLDVQAPYRRHLRRLELGIVLDVGCGIGRNLRNLGGHAVGIDHNPTSVARARAAGFVAYTPEEFERSPEHRPGRFDSLLLAHVLEHMSRREAVALVGRYLDLIRIGGRVVLITPQERGYRTDPTHVEFLDFASHRELARALGLELLRQDSFPFPRPVGKLFPYNEFVTVAQRTNVRQ